MSFSQFFSPSTVQPLHRSLVPRMPEMDSRESGQRLEKLAQFQLTLYTKLTIPDLQGYI